MWAVTDSRPLQSVRPIVVPKFDSQILTLLPSSNDNYCSFVGGYLEMIHDLSEHSPPYPNGEELPDEDCASAIPHVLARRGTLTFASQTGITRKGFESGPTTSSLVLSCATSSTSTSAL